MLQTIQEETATNIYLPSPLQGLLGPDFSQSPSNTSPNGSASKSSMNTIWITGEFFGVQRARDMLYQMSLNKVRLAHPMHSSIRTNRYYAGQAAHFEG